MIFCDIRSAKDTHPSRQNEAHPLLAQPHLAGRAVKLAKMQRSQGLYKAWRNLSCLTLCFYNHNRNLETSDLLSSQLANSCRTHENQNLSELNPVICHFIAHQFQFSIFGNLLNRNGCSDTKELRKVLRMFYISFETINWRQKIYRLSAMGHPKPGSNPASRASGALK